MQRALVSLVCLLYIQNAFGTQQVEYSTTHTANTVTFTIKLFRLSDPVNAIAVSDTSAGTISTGLFTDACQYTTSTTPVQLSELTDAFGESFLTFLVLIDYTDPGNPTFSYTGTELGCYFTSLDAAAGKFRFHIRGLDSLAGASGTDREFKIESTGTDTANVVDLGSLTFLNAASLVTVVAPTAYTAELIVVDAGQTAKTYIALGETAQLKFTMTTNPHTDKMDLSGARLTNCVVSKNADFSAPADTFIGNNGCFDTVDIFENVETNTGFSKDASSSKVGNLKTYIAFSPKFEMSAFTNNPVNAPNPLYFRCDLTFCLDDTDSSTPGQCGASHCNPARRKRDTQQKPEASVFASVNITTNRESRKKCTKCSESKVFKVTVAVLSTAVAIAFGIMTLTFVAAKHAVTASVKGERKDVPISCTGSAKSVTGSDVKQRKERLPKE